MADLTKLLDALQQEAVAKQAEVTAAETQLRALQQAHGEMLGQVDKVKKDLARYGGQVGDVQRQANQTVNEAQTQASAIVREADKMNREASAVLAAAEQNAIEIINAAKAQAKKIVDAMAGKQTELHDANNELNITQSKSQALKKQALDFGNS